MLLSKIFENQADTGVIKIVNEQEFDRFARTTSVSSGKVCVFLAKEFYIRTIPTNASMIITTEEIAEQLDGDVYGICISTDPKATFFKAFIRSNSPSRQDSFLTEIGENTSIAPMASISPKNVKIGDNVIIEDFVTIYENVTIGDNCIIRSGVRLGVQDYNYFQDASGLHHLPHFGELIIEDNVEIGFNTVVGRSLYPGDKTIIGKDSKLANCCGVGHDCKIGQRVLIHAGTMVAGYVEIGDDTHIMLNCSIKNGIKIGANVHADMGSVVIRSIPDNQTVFGNPAKRVVTPQL